MSKLWALYTNEMTKIVKRASILVILIAMAVVMAGFGLLIRVSVDISVEDQENNDTAENIYNENRNSLENYIESYEKELFGIKEEMDSADEFEAAELKLKELSINQEIEKLNFFKDNNILFSYNDLLDFRIEAYGKLDEYRYLLSNLQQKQDKNEKDNENITFYSRQIEKIDASVKSNDMKGFIDTEKERLDRDSSLSDEARDVEKEILDLRLQMQPDEKPPLDYNYFSRGQNISMGLSTLRALKQSLVDDVDYRERGYTNFRSSSLLKPLNDTTREEIEKDLTVAVYKLKNGISISTMTGEDSTPYIVLRGLMGIGTFAAIVLLIMLGGSAISSEISTGSIKSLIVAPVRRWKIVTAKLLSLVTVWSVLFLLVYALSVLIKGIFFGFAPGDSYVYAAGGKAFEMGHYLYNFLYLLLDFVPIFIYTILAFMLSSITRNTAASVGITMGIYFAGSIITTFLTLFSVHWADFLPFAHLSLADRVFPDNFAMMASAGSLFGGISLSTNPPLTFSVIYICIMIFCFGYTSFDSFCRRDIK